MDSQYDVILYLFYAFLCVCFLKVSVHLLLWLWVLQVMHLMLKVPALYLQKTSVCVQLLKNSASHQDTAQLLPCEIAQMCNRRHNKCKIKFLLILLQQRLLLHSIHYNLSYSFCMQTAKHAYSET